MKDKVIECLIKYLAIAKNRWPELQFDLPTIDFSLRGRRAGEAHYRSNKIRLNFALMQRNLDGFFNDTIPHELAHLVAFKVYGLGIKPHGAEWQRVMRIFGLEPVRCHSYDTTGLVRLQERFAYRCKCRQHSVSKTLHNRMTTQGWAYRCKFCLTTLEKI